MITQVDWGVWRGPRPKPSDFAAIQAKFATVICLESHAEDLRERTELAPAGVLERPISDWQIYVPGISLGYLEEIVSDVQCAKKPVFVHCEHGRDRTGLVIASYLVTTGQLTPAAAWLDALNHGYRDWLNFGLNCTWKTFCKSRGI